MGNGNTDVHEHEDRTNQEESPCNHDQNELPTLSDAASSWEVELDEKQFIAFKVISCSCSFCLHLVINGTEGETDWSNLLSSGLYCDCIEERNELIKILEQLGAMQQLVMFLTGPAGCVLPTSRLAF